MNKKQDCFTESNKTLKRYIIKYTDALLAINYISCLICS